MGKILQILLAILCVSVLLSGALFLTKYSDHYFSADIEETDNQPEPIKIGEYIVSFEMPSHMKEAIKPILPDLSNYSSSLIQKTIPDVGDGVVEVQKLETAYPKVRNDIAYYSNKQERLDPLAISVESGVVNLEAVYKAVKNNDYIKINADGGYTLNIPLIVKSKATLILEEGDTLLLNANHAALIAVLGTVNVMNAHILGWDTAQDQPAYFIEDDDFRPYLVAWCGSRLNIINSYLAYLGYNAPKAYGLTYSSCKNDKYVEEGTLLESGTGWILDNEFENFYFGFYSYGTKDAVLINNKYKDNIVYGIDPHDSSADLVIANNHVSGTRRKHGIITSRDVNNSYIVNNIVENNRGTGIMLDRNSHNNVIAYNTSRFNGHDGLSFYESPSNISYKNILYSNGKSGLRVRNSWAIKSHKDIINDNKGYAVELYSQSLKTRQPDDIKDPYQLKSDLSLLQNEIIGNEIGVFNIKDAESLSIYKSSLFEVEGDLFSGDLQSLKKDILLETDQLLIEKQN